MLIKISTDTMKRFKEIYEKKTGIELNRLMDYSAAVEEVLINTMINKKETKVNYETHDDLLDLALSQVDASNYQAIDLEKYDR